MSLLSSSEDAVAQWQEWVTRNFYKRDNPFVGVDLMKTKPSVVISSFWVGGEYTPEARKKAIWWIIWTDNKTASYGDTVYFDTTWESINSMVPHMWPRIFRVEIEDKYTSVVLLNMGIDMGEADDLELEGDYPTPQALPEWLQEKLAVLMLTKSDPPTEEVEGVGRRMSENVFWVYC